MSDPIKRPRGRPRGSETSQSLLRREVSETAKLTRLIRRIVEKEVRGLQKVLDSRAARDGGIDNDRRLKIAQELVDMIGPLTKIYDSASKYLGIEDVDKTPAISAEDIGKDLLGIK